MTGLAVALLLTFFAMIGGACAAVLWNTSRRPPRIEVEEMPVSVVVLELGPLIYMESR